MTILKASDVNNYDALRGAVLAHLRERFGELAMIGNSLYRAEDGREFLISYVRKNKTGAGWISIVPDSIAKLDHPKGYFALAYVDRGEKRIFVFEIPITVLQTKIEESQLKPQLRGRYSLSIVFSRNEFRLTKVNLPIQSYLTREEAIEGELPGSEVSPPEDDGEDETPGGAAYTADQFLAETYLARETLDELVALLEDKKQIILYGPPGTGKTHVAQKLARLFAGGDETNVQLIQFHPSYSYEEFMEGIRPEARKDGPPCYPVRPGVFRAFCDRARGQAGRHVLIIDEINRGNIAKVFGELMFLLEYRDRQVALPYSGAEFSIPDNVYLIGTMNTADRSIALVDFALRRRFHFYHFGADRDVLLRWIDAHGCPVPYLPALFDAVNRAIDDRDYQIGFSHFMKPGLTETDLRRVWRYSVEPYLEEYFFDNKAKLDELRWDKLVERVRGTTG